MTAEIQTLSFITHQLEKLPLKDSGFGHEKCSTLLYCRSYGDEKFLQRKRTRTNSVSQRPGTTAGVVPDTWYPNNLPFSSETRKDSTPSSKGKQVAEQGSQLLVQTIIDGSASKRVSHGFTAPNKRKRPTEAIGCECSPITKFCDEEVRTLCRANDAGESLGTVECQNTILFSGDEGKTARTASSCFSSQEMQSETRKWRGRPSINVEQMQRSGVWFPFKSRGKERKVKIIKVTPCDPDQSKLTIETYLPEFRDNCLFRPIGREDGDAK